MLSGIKTGKKKKKVIEKAASHDTTTNTEPPSSQQQSSFRTANEVVAAALRQGLTVPAQTILLPGEKSNYTNEKAEEEMSMTELLVHEKSLHSFADQETKSWLRQKKRPRKAVDSDDEEEQAMKRWQPKASSRNNQMRQQQLERKTEGVTQQCWWWIESTRFSESRLLAASSHVTLTMNYPRIAIPGKFHLYLTPIPHAPALANCDESVWAELRQFQTSLRNMAAAQKETVIFYETVLPNGRIWQTRLEVVFVPINVGQDAPLYFRSALTEQAEEWGTHQKLRTVTTGLRNAVPANFSYFYVEYGVNNGHLQMIENKAFPKDFGADTIAGIMDLEPMRMRNREAQESEQDLVASFMDKFKPFDWTNSAK